jgi:hypothetical protein
MKALLLVLLATPAFAQNGMPACYTCDNEAAIRSQAASDQTWTATYQSQVDSNTSSMNGTLNGWGVTTTAGASGSSVTSPTTSTATSTAPGGQ